MAEAAVAVPQYISVKPCTALEPKLRWPSCTVFWRWRDNQKIYIFRPTEDKCSLVDDLFKSYVHAHSGFYYKQRLKEQMENYNNEKKWKLGIKEDDKKHVRVTYSVNTNWLSILSKNFNNCPILVGLQCKRELWIQHITGDVFYLSHAS